MRMWAVFSRAGWPGLSWLATAALGYTLLLASAGCGKANKASTASPAAPTTTQTVAGATAVANQAPDLAELNRQLRRWIVQNRRPPKNFEDFASSVKYQIPPPPGGKKYFIDKAMHVTLVNR